MAFHVDIDTLAGSMNFLRVQPMPTSSSDKLFYYDYVYGSETYEWALNSTQIAPGAVIVGTSHAAPCGVTRYIVVSVKNARLTLASGPLVKHVSIADVKRHEQA